MLPYGIYLLSDKLILLTFVVSPLIARLFDYNWLDRQIGRIKGKVIFVINHFCCLSLIVDTVMCANCNRNNKTNELSALTHSLTNAHTYTRPTCLNLSQQIIGLHVLLC